MTDIIHRLARHQSGVDLYHTVQTISGSRLASIAVTFNGRYLPLIAEIAAVIQAYEGHYLNAGITLASAEFLRFSCNRGEKELEEKLKEM